MYTLSVTGAMITNRGNQVSEVKRGYRKKKNFHIVYNMIYDLPISTDAKIVYGYLSRCADSEGQAFPSYVNIMKKCGFGGRDRVNNALKALISIGLIEKKQRFRSDGGRSSNLYIIYEEPLSHDYGDSDSVSCPGAGQPPVREPDEPPSGSRTAPRPGAGHNKYPLYKYPIRNTQ